jgi:hypothetical protein
MFVICLQLCNVDFKSMCHLWVANKIDFQVWGIFYGILSVSQNTVMDLNNVMMVYKNLPRMELPIH